jgi:hypothetical protein
LLRSARDIIAPAGKECRRATVLEFYMRSTYPNRTYIVASCVDGNRWWITRMKDWLARPAVRAGGLLNQKNAALEAAVAAIFAECEMANDRDELRDALGPLRFRLSDAEAAEEVRRLREQELEPTAGRRHDEAMRMQALAIGARFWAFSDGRELTPFARENALRVARWAYHEATGREW